MAELNAVELLTATANARAHADLIRMDYEAKKKEIMKSVAQDLADLDAEFEPTMTAAAGVVHDLEEQVRVAVMVERTSIKAAGLHAVYNRPRVSWNTEALEGYALDHPEILRFKTEGFPSVALRIAK